MTILDPRTDTLLVLIAETEIIFKIMIIETEDT